MQENSIAIDGPSGAGKSTLSRRTAEYFHIIHVDTGALYRAVGVAAMKLGVDIYDSEAVTAILPGIIINLKYDETGAQRVFLGDDDVSNEIRTPDASTAASVTSAMPPVRAFLLDTQRSLAERHDVVMDGRDIGTVVLPNAGVKIFLTASPEVRAYRRMLDLQTRGITSSLEDVLAEQKSRDERDSTRAAAPLKKADEAILLDTSKLSLDEAFFRIVDIIEDNIQSLHVSTPAAGKPTHLGDNMHDTGI